MIDHILTEDQYNQALEMLSLFKIDGVTADKMATPSQVELFGRIVFKISPRQFIMTPTQYGKSLFVAFACIILTALDDEGGDKVIVGAPTEEKAMIIMRYYTQHLNDSPLFAPLLSPDTKVERLSMSTSRDALVLKNGGSMSALTMNAGNSQKGFESAMGEGCDDFILDEACLIPDKIEATAIRMISGRKNGMYIKIGNPFYSGTHFQQSSRDPRYLKLIIDYHVSIKEGRMTQDYIEEVRGKPFFDILYECKFPVQQQTDAKGYTILYKDSLLDMQYLTQPLPIMGEKHLGCDVSHGGDNYSTIVIRGTNAAKLLFKEHTQDELILLGEIEKICKKEDIPLCSRRIHGDSIGSAALWSRANELWPICQVHGHTNRFGVNVGEKASPELLPIGEPMVDDQTGKPIILFINKRAQLAWRGQEWVQRGGKLFPKPDFDDLLGLRYKIQSDKKIKLKGKDEMAEEGIASPDVADAFNLTFDVKPKANAYRPDKQYEPEQMTAFGI